MARVIFSPLFSSILGKMGEAVCSKWKGRHYVRKRVIPANPKSDDQTTQRNFLAKVVAWFHDLPEDMLAYLDILAQDTDVSGFNLFVARNLKDLADAADPRMLPLTAEQNPVSTAAGAAGGGSKSIHVTWAQGFAAATDVVRFLAEPTGQEAGTSGLAEIPNGTTADEESADLTMPEGATEYNIWLICHDEATDKFSIAAMCTATSAAA